MRAIVVRHYKTMFNSSGQIIGWGDSPRAKDWQADMDYVDGILKEQGFSFAAIYTSNLERARQTGMHYARCHGIKLIHDSAELNEVNYGKLYRKSKKWVEKHIPEHKRDPDFVYPEGESFRQMQTRSVEFLETISAKHKGQTVLVVVHAGVIRGLISHFLDLPYADNLKRKITHRYIGDFQIENGRCKRYAELGMTSGFFKDGRYTNPVPG